jgi:UDP-glucose 4-epimerase
MVTGGFGFVGRSVLRLLGEQDCDVLVVDIAEPPLDLPLAIRHAQVDIRDSGALAEVVQQVQPDAMIHLAAIHFIPLCERNPSLALSTNTLGTVNLLNVAPAGCRFVFASSAAVYAPSSELHVEDSSAIGPMDVYGLTKLDGERYVSYFAAQRLLQAVNVRLFNVVGPGETNPHLLPDILAQVKAGRREIALGNLFPRRDYIHVDDAAAGFVAAATRGQVAAGATQTVNLGTSVQHSVVDAIQLLQEVSGIRLAVVEDPSKLRKSDRPFLGADIDKMKRSFDWAPQRTLRDALGEAWLEPRFSADLKRTYGLA